MKASTQQKIKVEKKKVSYTAKLYLSYISAAIILVLITNIIVKFKGFPNSSLFIADEATWIGFYGTLIGGFITLWGVNQTIRFTQQEDKRLQQIEQEKKKRESDLRLIRHLWELETEYHQLSKNLHLTITRLDELHEPSINELEEVFAFFQTSMRAHDFITLSSRIDWQTYKKVTERMKELRRLFIQAASDLLENRTIEDRVMIKMRLAQDLRKQKIEVDQVDELFEEKRALLEGANMDKL